MVSDELLEHYRQANSQVDHPVAHSACRLSTHVVSKRLQLILELAGGEAM
jgi:hypothetical protein